jgi:hypothetical protein
VLALELHAFFEVLGLFRIAGLKFGQL